MTIHTVRINLRESVIDTINSFTVSSYTFCLLKDYNILNNNYLPIIHNADITYNLNLFLDLSQRVPNSISRIKRALFFPSTYFYHLTIKNVKFILSRHIILSEDKEVKMILCLDKNKINGIRDEGISTILKESFVTKKKYFEGLTLFIEKDFTKNDASKSLYKRLEKDYIPCLIENDVKISIVSKEFLERNVFNPSTKVFTPLEKTEYIEGIIDKIKTKIIDSNNLPF